METKLSKVKAFVAAGNWARALSIVSRFPSGFSKDEKRTIQIASESLNGHGSFYASLGIDCHAMIENAKAIVTNKYNF